ncbi:MAG: hypothetical protein KatS3mg115_0798 [Candidatus Poribacteria bacterium]|nr:MAG: hypothetical protein KatS3mg115_0798 [Candidatus Poribacteria bacterium]
MNLLVRCFLVFALLVGSSGALLARGEAAVLAVETTPAGPHSIGDRVTVVLRLRTDADAGAPELFPPPASESVEWGRPTVQAGPQAGEWIVRIPVQLFAVGRLSEALPPLRVGTETLELPPLSFEVKSVRSGPGASLLRDPKPPVVLDRRLWWPFLLALGALLAGAAGWLLRFHRRRPQPAPVLHPPSPEEWIAQALAPFAERRPQDREELRRYLEAVANCVREYLHQRTGVPAPRLTTSETLLRLRPRLPEGIATELAAILSGADAAKFAKQTPETFQPRQYVARVLEISRQIGQRWGDADQKARRPAADQWA